MNITSDRCKEVILRNLSRIMDMRVINFDMDAKLLTFLYTDSTVLRKIQQELRRIGFPIQHLTGQRHTNLEEVAGSF